MVLVERIYVIFNGNCVPLSSIYFSNGIFSQLFFHIISLNVFCFLNDTCNCCHLESCWYVRYKYMFFVIFQNRLAVGVGWWHVAGPVAPQPVGRQPTERAGEEQQGPVGRHAKPLVEWAAPREVYQVIFNIMFQNAY